MKVNIKNSVLIGSWALYDLANQFFALNIVSLYFVSWLIVDKKVPELYYSVAFAVSVLFVAVLSPLLGAISDASQRHRLFLIIFTLISVFFTMILGWTDNVFLALVFFGVANLGCQLAGVFYNALMVNISPPGRIGIISGLGRTFSYLGAGVALFITKPVVLAHGYQATFIPTGFLFLIFALPCMALVKDKNPRKLDLSPFLKQGGGVGLFRSMYRTLLTACKDRDIRSFFLSISFSLAAVNVLILFMSVYAKRAFHLDEAQIIHLVGFSVFFAVAGSLFSGWLCDRFGYRLSLNLVYILWILCLISGALARNNTLYYVIGAAIGLALGSIWVVVRAVAIKMVPQEKIGEMFGLFNFAGYFSAIIGSIYWGLVLKLAEPLGDLRYRVAMVGLSVFMFLGIFFLRKIPANK